MHHIDKEQETQQQMEEQQYIMQIKDIASSRRANIQYHTVYNSQQDNSHFYFEGGQPQDPNIKQQSANRQTPQQQNIVIQDNTRNSLQFSQNQQFKDISQFYNEKTKNRNEQSGFSGRNKQNNIVMSAEKGDSNLNNQNLVNRIIDQGNIQQNKQQNLNLIKNSKNRKLYTSIGAYNNNVNQGNKSIIDSNISSMSGFNNVGIFNQAQKIGNTINNQSEIISFSGQNTSSNGQKNKINSNLLENEQIFTVINGAQGANNLYNALAQTNLGKFGNLQQRNLIVSQQQSHKNKVKLQAFDTELNSQVNSDHPKQNQQKTVKSQNDSSQNLHQNFMQHQQIVNQQNKIQQNNKNHVQNSNQQMKQKNKSFNEGGKQNDTILKSNGNETKFQSDQIVSSNLQQNSNLFQQDPQQ